MQRLDKVLSDAGIATRKEIRGLVRAELVTVNGICVSSPEQKVEDDAQIAVRGEMLERRRVVVLALHKPAGYLTATEDRYQPTVMDLIPEHFRKWGVVPVGRLDKATEGLLLLTNDGDLAHRLISPKNDVEKVYYAEHDGTAGADDVRAFAEGIILEDGTRCRPAVLEPLGAGKSRVTVTEGKYHQVRRMMDSRHLHVNYLRREREGSLSLEGLALGEMTEIDPKIFDRMK
ncbi:MAG: rRNA pseudouridine synthase [Oscillospiraceae bacterium]|nr:rRNA pseudouridine synthase [Oscillospiraceae bacterium]